MSNSALCQRLSGVFTALVTPMQDGRVDLSALERHIDVQLEAGISGLVPVGTTGEAATLTDDETDEVIRLTVKAGRDRAFVMAGAGSNNTSVAVTKAQRAAALGVDGLLIVTPYYNKPSQAGMFDHFSAIAKAVDLPIMLYSVPGRTGVELGVGTCARLAQSHENIVGIKEAGGRVERVTELRIACGDDFVIHSGDDALTLPFMASGANGVTSVASNLLPEDVVALCKTWAAGDVQAARRIHEKLYDVIGHLFIESNPVPVKAALARRGTMRADVRAPLAPLQPESIRALEQSLASFERANL